MDGCPEWATHIAWTKYDSWRSGALVSNGPVTFGDDGLVETPSGLMKWLPAYDDPARAGQCVRLVRQAEPVRWRVERVAGGDLSGVRLAFADNNTVLRWQGERLYAELDALLAGRDSVTLEVRPVEDE